VPNNLKKNELWRSHCQKVDLDAGRPNRGKYLTTRIKKRRSNLFLGVWCKKK